MSTTTVAPENAFASHTVGQVVAERPGRARILENYGIDYCCGGKMLLSEACAEKGLDFAAVAQEIEEYDASHVAAGTDWTKVPMSQLAEHISRTHHEYLARELPRIEYLADRVRNAHGDRHPDLHDLNALVHELSHDLQDHTRKEEEILFPCIRILENASSIEDIKCESVAGHIKMMEAEHDEAGGGLEKIRELTNNYTPPADTCNTHRVFLEALHELEHDLHTHIHKENSILFPRAIAREEALRAQ